MSEELLTPSEVVGRALKAQHEAEIARLVRTQKIAYEESLKDTPEGRAAALPRKQEDQRKCREYEMRERREAKRVELRARERELVSHVENIDFTTSPTGLAKCTAELAAVRRILATIPEPEVPAAPRPEPGAEKRLQIEHLKERHRALLREAAHIRAHQVPGVETQLRQPFKSNIYKAPYIHPSMSSPDAEALINRAYEEAKSRQFGPLLQKKTFLLAQADKFEKQAEEIAAQIEKQEGGA